MAVHAELPARGATVWTRWASVDAVTCEDRTTDRRACTRSAVGARPETDSATDAGTGAPPAMEYTLVLALAVPPLAQRDLLITVTFGVVLLSILLQGLTIKPLLHRLAIVRHDARQRYDIKRGEIRMTQAALDEIAQLERLHGAPLSLLRELSEEYEARSREAVAAVEALRLERDDLRAEESIRARRQVLIAEKDAVLADFHSGASRRKRSMRSSAQSMRDWRLSTPLPTGPIARNRSHRSTIRPSLQELASDTPRGIALRTRPDSRTMSWPFMALAVLNTRA